MDEPEGRECPADLLSQAVSIASTDGAAGLGRTDELLAIYSHDPKLHFLRGSLLAGLTRYGEARVAMAKAIGLAPGYSLARFQLGLLELSSGDAADAEMTWAPLGLLSSENPLRVFAEGLRCLIADRFVDAIRILKEGISLNTENPVINSDMQLMIKKMSDALDNSVESASISAAHLLLQQYSDKATRH